MPWILLSCLVGLKIGLGFDKVEWVERFLSLEEFAGKFKFHVNLVGCGFCRLIQYNNILGVIPQVGFWEGRM